MELPIFENESPAGVLRIARQGLYTLFEARLPPATGLTRLWLLGGGRVCCLGLMEPKAEGRFLCRRLTRLQMASLPPRMDTALALPADAGAPPPPPLGEVPSAARRKGEDHAQAAPLKRSAPAPPAGEPKESVPPAPWTRLADGSLLDPARRLLALPCAPGAAPQTGKITLSGREYWLFRT